MRKYGRYTRRKFLRDSALFSAGLTGLSLAGCTTTTQPTTTAATTAATTTVATTRTPKSGGTLHLSRSGTATDYDSRTGDARHGPQIWGMVLQKLVQSMPDASYEKVLCEDYTLSADFKTINFTLRDDVKFHDDSDFTGQDIKDQMEVIIGIQEMPSGMRYTGNYEDLESVDLDGDLELTFNLKYANNDYMMVLAKYNICYVIPSEQYTNPERPDQLIGTGPYTFDIDNYESGSTFTLNKWSDYWGNGLEGYWKGTCYINEVITQMVAEESVRWSALQAGDADLIDFSTTAGFLNAEAAGGPYTFHMADADTLQTIYPNVRNSPFDELEFRQAYFMAIDWDQFINVVYPGMDRWVDNFEGSRFAYPDQSYLMSLLPTYDPDEAESIFQSYEDDGKLRTINYVYDPNSITSASGDYFVTEFAKLGITVNLVEKTGRETRSFLQNNVDLPADPASEPDGWWDFHIGGGAAKGTYAPWSAYYSNFFCGYANPEATYMCNFMGIDDAEINDWILESKSADDTRRHELYNMLQEKTLSQSYWTPLIGDIQMWANAEDLVGLEEFCSTWRQHNWSISGLWLDR